MMSVFLAIVLTLSFTYYRNFVKAVSGDINADGSLTITDAMLILNHLSGKKSLNSDQLAIADINGDGKVTISDAIKILNILSGKEQPENSEPKGTFTFTTYGWGHDIGMSQWGAHYYAKNDGWDYQRIITHYYPGTSIVTDENMPSQVTCNGKNYSVRDYLAGTLAAEMGNYFSLESLKAQALAQYTYTKYHGFANMTNAHHYFKETTDSTLYKAVDAVLGKYISYKGKPILAAYFSTSAGKTAASDLVWYSKLDYLCGGVESKYDVNVSGYKVTKTYTAAELKQKLESIYGVKLSSNPSKWLKIVSHNKAVSDSIGHVITVNIDGQRDIKGANLYVNLSLRSPCYTVSYKA